MGEVDAFEARNKLGALLDRVEDGEEVVITRHGKAIARLVPNRPNVNSALTEAALQRIRARAAKLHIEQFDWTEWKALRDEGRS